MPKTKKQSELRTRDRVSRKKRRVDFYKTEEKRGNATGGSTGGRPAQERGRGSVLRKHRYGRGDKTVRKRIMEKKYPKIGPCGVAGDAIVGVGVPKCGGIKVTDTLGGNAVRRKE